MKMYGPREPNENTDEENRNLLIQKAIEKYIIEKLGKPAHYSYMEVKHLWGEFYRVNVLCREKKAESFMATFTRPDSFFMRVEDNKVESCDPKVVRRYK